MKISKKIIKNGLRFVLRYVKGYFEKERFKPSSIPRVSIETTNICNSKCVFCANKVMKRKRQHLEMSLFKKAVNEFAAMGGNTIDFNAVIGDPLLDKYLLQRARYVKKFPQFKSLGFVTTLQWLHLFDINEFFDSGITWLSISCILSGRERYFELFGVDKYDIFLKNLLILIEENNKRKNKISILMGIKPTDEPISDVINHQDFKMINSLLDQDLVHTLKKQGVYYDDWLGAINLPNYLKRRPLYFRLFRPCRLLYNQIIIFSNGNIGVCSCKDFEANSELIFGSLKDITLQEMWSGEKLENLRFNWVKKNKVPNICKSCRHYIY